MTQSLNYSDVYLIPSYSEIKSRDNITTEIEFLGRRFKCPVLPANMATTIDFNLAEQLSESGYFYILHRFYPYEKIIEWVRANKKLKTISISVGVKDEDKYFLQSIYHYRVDFVTIDVAHGHHILVKKMIESVKSYAPKSKIIAGNVMTPQAVIDLKSWGADAVKVGLSQGKGCSTYNTTGVGSCMFSTIQECSKYNIPVIADGGIKEKADICKALVADASMVMIGSLFCQLKDSPAESFQRKEMIRNTEFGSFEVPEGPEMKVYYGSASSRNKCHNKYIEGKERVLLAMKDQTYLEYLDEVEQGLRSCMSYGGFSNIQDLKKMAWKSF